jgi:LacI family transcriptional regulator
MSGASRNAGATEIAGKGTAGKGAAGKAARPTMRDVAARAGVSLKTVSRVLNGEPAVHPKTRDRVLGAATALGFRRNDIAASLRRIGQSMETIGVVIEDVANPFYGGVLRGVEEVTRARGYLLITASSDEDAALERETLSAFLSRRVDGLIVVPAGTDHSYLAADMAQGTALVFADRPAGGLQADCVLGDNESAAAEAVRHLRGYGHRRIGFVGDDPDLYTAQERFRGYRNELRRARIPLDRALVRQGVRNVDAAYAAADDLIRIADPPTAILTGNNRSTIGTVRRLRQHDRAVALVGFDDFELADVLDPPVTVVTHDARSLGRAAAQRLLARLDGDTSPPRTIRLPATLIERGSGEITRVAG